MRRVRIALLMLPLLALPSWATDDIKPCLEHASCSFCMGPFTLPDGVTVITPSVVRYWIAAKNAATTSLLLPVTSSNAPDASVHCTTAGAWGVVVPPSAQQWTSGSSSQQPSEDHVFCYQWPTSDPDQGLICVTFPMTRQKFSAAWPTPGPTATP